MLRSLIAACAVSLLLAPAGGGPAGADNEHGVDERRDHCLDLLYWFDAAKTDNAAAIALRDAAERNCRGAPDNTVHNGTEQIRRALQMIGIAS